MRVVFLICLWTAVAHADPQRVCLTLPAGQTSAVVGDRLYALHRSFIANDLFVIELRPRLRLVTRIAFTKVRPSALVILEDRIRLTGILASSDPRTTGEPRVVELSLDGRLLDPTPAGRAACAYPEVLPSPTTTATARAVHSPIGHVIEVRDGSIDHGGLVILNHREFIRSLPRGECLQYPPACSEAHLETQLRVLPFELVVERDGLLYSLSLAGLAVHRLDTLALVDALRWPKLLGIMMVLV